MPSGPLAVGALGAPSTCEISETLMDLYAVELRSECWEKSLAWYREVLGLWVAIRIPEDQYALLMAGSSRIALMGRDRGGLNQRISLAFEIDDLEPVAKRLSQHQTEFRRIDNHAEGLKMLVTADPDGNQINVFCWPGLE